MSAPDHPTGALPFTIVSRETIWRGFCSLERLVFDRHMRSGETRRQTFEIENHGHAVAVLPYDPALRQAILVRQLRLPQALDGEDGMSLEIIAGLLDVDGEGPEATARREAMEEAGLVLRSLQRIGATRSSPGLSREKVTLFLAEVDLATARTGDGGGSAHEGEDIEVVVMTLADLARRADTGEGLDLKSLFAVQTLRLKRPELFA